jgi:UPF0042 nucleotide-binding protein
MPVALLPKFLDLPRARQNDVDGLAFVMDLREKSFLAQYPTVFDSLQQTCEVFEIIFVEADEEVLLQRYSQTRRYHPTAGAKSLIEGIRTEKALLAELKKAAHMVIDTSRLNVHELKAKIGEIAARFIDPQPMRVYVVSFGFKYGIPVEADLLIDVRFMTNPYFIPALKPLDGESQAVSDFVRGQPETGKFLKKYTDLLDYLIPLYEKEGKAYLTVAVGCTGGRHRSVVIARCLTDHLENSRDRVEIKHRDIDREAAAS